MDSSGSETFKYLGLAIVISFVMTIIGIIFNVSQLNHFLTQADAIVQRSGAVTTTAQSQLQELSSKLYNNQFQVLANQSDTTAQDYGDSVEYTVAVNVKGPGSLSDAPGANLLTNTDKPDANDQPLLTGNKGYTYKTGTFTYNSDGATSQSIAAGSSSPLEYRIGFGADNRADFANQNILKPGHIYTASVQMKGTTTKNSSSSFLNNNMLLIRTWYVTDDGTGTYTTTWSYGHRVSVGLSSDYQTVTATLKIPENAVGAGFGLQMRDPFNFNDSNPVYSFTTWPQNASMTWKNFKIEEGTTATAYNSSSNYNLDSDGDPYKPLIKTTIKAQTVSLTRGAD